MPKFLTFLCSYLLLSCAAEQDGQDTVNEAFEPRQSGEPVTEISSPGDDIISYVKDIHLGTDGNLHILFTDSYTIVSSLDPLTLESFTIPRGSDGERLLASNLMTNAQNETIIFNHEVSVFRDDKDFYNISTEEIILSAGGQLLGSDTRLLKYSDLLDVTEIFPNNSQESFAITDIVEFQNESLFCYEFDEHQSTVSSPTSVSSGIGVGAIDADGNFEDVTNRVSSNFSSCKLIKGLNDSLLLFDGKQWYISQDNGVSFELSNVDIGEHDYLFLSESSKFYRVSFDSTGNSTPRFSEDGFTWVELVIANASSVEKIVEFQGNIVSFSSRKEQVNIKVD